MTGLTGPTAVLTTQGLSKRYGSVQALRDCSLSLPAGRVVGLVGPNGAGKTTLLHLALGLLEPTAGSIQVLGYAPRAHEQEVLARAGFVAQQRPLYKQFTGEQHLQLGAHLNAHWDDARARERLRRYAIPLDRTVRTLSGGQQAQVALALALGKRPPAAAPGRAARRTRSAGPPGIPADALGGDHGGGDHRALLVPCRG
jgi:ABC-2 type transport system ATP-binding protein